MGGRHIALFAVAAAAAVCGCKEERAPESIPFEGIDPEAQADRPKPKPVATASASASVNAPAPSYKPRQVSTSKLQACCSALRAGATYGDEGERAVNKQALSICTHKISAVRTGKLSEAAALSQVRAALLRGAPAPCR